MRDDDRPTSIRPSEFTPTYSELPPREIYVYDETASTATTATSTAPVSMCDLSTPARHNLTTKGTDVSEPNLPPKAPANKESKKFTFDGLTPASSVAYDEARDNTEDGLEQANDDNEGNENEKDDGKRAEGPDTNEDQQLANNNNNSVGGGSTGTQHAGREGPAATTITNSITLALDQEKANAPDEGSVSSIDGIVVLPGPTSFSMSTGHNDKHSNNNNNNNKSNNQSGGGLGMNGWCMCGMDTAVPYDEEITLIEPEEEDHDATGAVDAPVAAVDDVALPCDDIGLKGDDIGLPGDNNGLPGDSNGLPGDDIGLPGDDIGLPLTAEGATAAAVATAAETEVNSRGAVSDLSDLVMDTIPTQGGDDDEVPVMVGVEPPLLPPPPPEEAAAAETPPPLLLTTEPGEEVEEQAEVLASGDSVAVLEVDGMVGDEVEVEVREPTAATTCGVDEEEEDEEDEGRLVPKEKRTTTTTEGVSGDSPPTKSSAAATVMVCHASLLDDEDNMATAPSDEELGSKVEPEQLGSLATAGAANKNANGDQSEHAAKSNEPDTIVEDDFDNNPSAAKEECNIIAALQTPLESIICQRFEFFKLCS